MAPRLCSRALLGRRAVAYKQSCRRCLVDLPLAVKPPYSSSSSPLATAKRLSSSASTTASSTASVAASAPPPLRSGAGSLVGWTVAGFFLTMAGFGMAVSEKMGLGELPVSAADSLKAYVPPCDKTREIEATINSHHVVRGLRANPGLIESRPHLQVQPAARKNNLTAGVLMGSGMVEVPPYSWRDDSGKELVAVSYLGESLCGHPGIVHGGFLATMLDEGLARCCFPALPHKVGVTANLDINYRSPAKAGSYVVLKATTTKVEGRKAWVQGRIETMPAEGEEPVLIADATALFISPRNAAVVKGLMPDVDS